MALPMLTKYVQTNENQDERRTPNAQQQFGKMAGSVLSWTFGFQINISVKMKVSASKSATSPSCETLYDILKKMLLNIEVW